MNSNDSFVMSCSNCKHSIFYPTVGRYKCIKHDCFSEDLCDEYKISNTDEIDGLAGDGKEDGEED